MIDPNTAITIRVGELPSQPFNLTDNIPHEVGNELKRGTVQQLSDLIASVINVSGGVGFRAVTVVDGQTLPSTTEQEFILVGKGTYYNVSGGETLVLTEELNAIVSNGSFWFIGVEIPVNVELAGITQEIRQGFLNTTPSENTVFNALQGINLSGKENTANKQNSLAVDGTGAKFPTVDAVNTGLATKISGTATNNFIPKTNSFGNLENSNFYGDSSFAPLYLPLFPANIESKSTIKGNANGRVAGKTALTITDNLDKPIFGFNNDGRLDLKSYTGDGAVSVLYNMAAIPSFYIGHYAFAARASDGNLHTTNILGAKLLDNTVTSINSKIELQYMTDGNGTGAYLQPNTVVSFSKNGFELPNIPIVPQNGILRNNGEFKTTGKITTEDNLTILKNGSDSIGSGNSIALAQPDGQQNILQMNASTGLDLYNNNSVRGGFEKILTVSQNGNIQAKTFDFAGTSISEPANGGGFTQVKIQPKSGNKDAVFLFAPSGTATNSVLEMYPESSLSGANRLVIKSTASKGVIGSDTSDLPIGFIFSNSEKITFNPTGNITANSYTGGATLTGTPTAPTATAGTNTTQIATTAFVTSAITTADSGNVKLTGNQTITGQKTLISPIVNNQLNLFGAGAGSGIISFIGTPDTSFTQTGIARIGSFMAFIGSGGSTRKPILFDASLLNTVSRTVRFQDSDGTIALTSNIPYTNQTITANKTVTIAEFLNNNELILSINATSGNITITLPTFTALQGYKLTVKKMDSSANSVLIQGVGGINIDGAATLVVSGQYSKTTVGANLQQYIIL